MNHWPFIIAAYGMAFLGIGGVMLWAWRSMRRAESATSDRVRSD
ncbi:heme exporter protein CcmD [Sphingomonas colocasiae]|uniref:Heme exporter protein D n=1 Tax=Sphingomonas colocasiae TaxID=1848973 RepID=A0ABS7PRN0_9SPHN|nr:heme exporter protein CcmD [Sphingomonas colocasiae]MBY8823933.1 heme exporter protein CcmD [Sphingomonas colocasiae]